MKKPTESEKRVRKCQEEVNKVLAKYQCDVIAVIARLGPTMYGTEVQIVDVKPAAAPKKQVKKARKNGR